MSGRFLRFGLLLATSLTLAATAGYAQVNLSCQASANPLLVRGEGLTERMGDILLQCTGGVPGSTVSGNLTVFLSVAMTNRIDSTGYSDLKLDVDSGSGYMPANTRAAYLNPASLSFSGFAFTLSPAGSVLIRLSNLRGAANQLGVNSAHQITALLSFNAGSLVTFSTSVFSVATVVRSFYSSYTSRLISTGNQTPPIIDNSMTGAIASHALYATVRISEGFNSAFGPKSDPNFQFADFGTRVIVRYSGVPAGVRLWLPDGVVGYDGVQPTSAGDYGLVANPGIYSPGSNSLLLIRIANADVKGGGSGSGPVIAPPSGPTQFDTLSEVAIGPDGSGQAVYEVFDANQLSVQSVTIPTYAYMPSGAVQTATQIGQDVILAGTSSTLETNAVAVIPRYVPVTPANDCLVVGDCNAGYFPKLAVNANVFDVTMTTLDIVKQLFVSLTNSGGGNFLWTATVTYTGGPANGYQWLRIAPPAGINSQTVRFDLVPGALPDGIYDAVVKIDGGPLAGVAQIKVTMRYSYKAPTPVVINAVNAANLKPGFLIPGSAAAILGDRLSGRNISVTFDGSPARVLSSNSLTRLDVQVPYDQAGKQYALIIVTIDNSSSTPGLLVPIGVSAPAIYQGSILNADNTGNGPGNGALAGSTIQVYSTGLPVAGLFSGKIHDRTIDGGSLVYAGPAPTLIGVQLMSMIVPSDLPSLTTGVAVCGGVTADTVVCSDFVDLTIVGAPQSAGK